MFKQASTQPSREEAMELFQRAFEAQQEHELPLAIRLYQESIDVFPTAEAHTFLGWVYSFQHRYDEAITECLNAINVDPEFGNPYNDIGSYLIAQGDWWGCVPWFERALTAPRYESYVFPHFNLGRVYESRHRFLDAARHYHLALGEKPDYTAAAEAIARNQARLN